MQPTAVPQHGAETRPPPVRWSAGRAALRGGALDGACAIGFYLLVTNLGPVLTAMISATTPVWAIVWGAVLLRERIGLRLGVGIAVTLLGVFLATADKMKPSATRREPPYRSAGLSGARSLAP